MPEAKYFRVAENRPLYFLTIYINIFLRNKVSVLLHMNLLNPFTTAQTNHTPKRFYNLIKF